MHAIRHAHLDKSMKEAQPKQQLLEGCWLLAAVEEGWITDGIIQVALHQVGPQALHTRQDCSIRRCYWHYLLHCHALLLP